MMKKFQSSLRTKRARLSRREIIRKGGALTALLMTGCDSQFYKPPVLRGGLMGIADTLTMATQRSLMSNNQLVQEHDSREVTQNFPVWNQRVIQRMRIISDLKQMALRIGFYQLPAW